MSGLQLIDPQVLTRSMTQLLVDLKDDTWQRKCNHLQRCGSQAQNRAVHTSGHKRSGGMTRGPLCVPGAAPAAPEPSGVTADMGGSAGQGASGPTPGTFPGPRSQTVSGPSSRAPAASAADRSRPCS